MNPAKNPYKFIGIHGPKPYKFKGFGDIHGPNPCEFIRFFGGCLLFMRGGYPGPGYP